MSALRVSEPEFLAISFPEAGLSAQPPPPDGRLRSLVPGRQGPRRAGSLEAAHQGLFGSFIKFLSLMGAERERGVNRKSELLFFLTNPKIPV